MTVCSFYEGYALGNAQWGLIDGVILVTLLRLLWPWRAVLRDPETRRRLKVFLGIEE